MAEEEQKDSALFRGAYNLTTTVVVSVVLSLGVGIGIWLLTPDSEVLKEAKRVDAELRKLGFDEANKGCFPPFQIQDARFTSAASLADAEKAGHLAADALRAGLEDFKAYSERVTAYVGACRQAREAKAWNPDAQKDALRAYREKMAAAKATWRKACAPPC